MRNLSRDARAYGIVGSFSVEVISIMYVGPAGGLIQDFLCDRRAPLSPFRLRRTGTDLGHPQVTRLTNSRTPSASVHAERAIAEARGRESAGAFRCETSGIRKVTQARQEGPSPSASAARSQKSIVKPIGMWRSSCHIEG